MFPLPFPYHVTDCIVLVLNQFVGRLCQVVLVEELVQLVLDRTGRIFGLTENSLSHINGKVWV